MSDLVHQCMTKALVAEGEERKTGPAWLRSRSGTLRLFRDRLEWGNWCVAYADIHAARLSSFRSPIGIPGYLLTVETEEQTYHFGLNGWGTFWNGELPFAVSREKGAFSHNWLSLAILFLALVSVTCLIGWFSAVQ